MPHLFGTDGVRGRAGRFPLDPPTVRRLGAALVRALKGGPSVRFLSGRDTRESGAWIERELAAGILSEGGELTSAGVVPTPAVAFLTRHLSMTAGVVISASHNPFEDNGIKVFSGTGEKFTEALESRVESIVADDSWHVEATAAAAVPQTDCAGDYLAHVERILPPDLRPRDLRLVVDCANGATTPLAPKLFERLRLDATVIGAAPDGRNINLGCGSTAPQALASAVVEGRYDLGVAFDGDGDRAIFVDATGAIVDGDAVMLMCATRLRQEGKLNGNAIVATVMSNLGLEQALSAAGIGLVRCPVGDKYVMEEMIARDLSLGGEQSGHVIFADHLFTGDGLATALQVLRTMASTGRSLRELASALVTYPQVLMNVRVARRVDLESVPEVAAVMSEVRSRLSGQGRLLVRYSGTEPLLRVMIEGRNEADIRRWGEEIITAAKLHLGAA